MFAGAAATAGCLLVSVLPGALDMPLEHAAYLAPPLAVAALPLHRPPDLRPTRRIRSTAGLIALLDASWLALLSVAALAVHPWRRGGPGTAGPA
ncbi:hypothetical protein AB0D29_25070 [Streptomyces sp. NPDC048424]|uniref:hypothetical protein n=1 Tax=Streptomyces sp. NPDC048424 TaxID=3155265 RepID=UPI003413DDC2